jgi:tetratricopeptide (TPR) repeat protein
MIKRNKCIFLLISFSFLCGFSPARQENTKAEKYFSLLQDRPDDSYLYDRFYDAWLDAGTIEQLESFLKANLDKDNDIVNRLLLAFFYERQGRDAQALELYRNIPANNSVTAEYLFCKAKAEARNLGFETAISDLVKARKLTNLDEIAEKAGKLLGELYIRTNQKDKAAELWNQLLETSNENQELYEDLIDLQINEGLFDDALRTSDKLISITKDEYKAVMRSLRKGDIYQYKADNQKALDIYAETLEMVGQGSWLENQICSQIEEIFNRDDNTNGLKDYLEGLVKAHPERTGLKKRLAKLLVDMGRDDEALEMLQEILKVTPGDKANQKAYVKTLTEAGQFDKAIALLEQLFEYNNQDREILISLADLYHRNEQDNKVGAILNRFLDLSDRTEYAYLRVGGILEQYKLKDQAETVYEQMIDAFGESLTSLQVYAQFLYRDNKKDEALGMFKTIAGKGDLQTMMRASNAAGTRGHYDLALEWVEARYGEFSDDVTYLNHLCKIAIRLKEFDKAVVWARHQLGMAKTFPMIRSAISQIMAAVDSSEKAGRLIGELEAIDRLTIQQTCLLSELLESQNLPVKANAVLAEAALIDPEMALRQQIHIYSLRSDWASAAERLEFLITETGTRKPDLIRELIELYQKSRRYEDGLKWVLVWEQISPASATARIYHSRLLTALGRNKDAVDILDAADREFDGNTEVLSQLARLHTSDGKYEDAQRIYWRLYETAENVSEKLRFVRNMSEAAGQTGKRQELIQRLKRQQQENRSSAVPLLGLAEVYRQMGKYEERRQALLEATRIQTDDIELIYELAAVEEAQGDWEKAAETLQRALTLDDTSQTRLKIARLYIQNGNKDDGFRILTEIAGGDRMDPRDAESLAGTIMSTGAWNTATSFLEGILSLHPKDYKLHYQYAVALEEDGRKAEAMEAFIDLLGFKDEIPGNKDKKIQFSWKRQGMDINIQQILPAEAIELLRFNQYHSTAYSYQQSRTRYSRSGTNRPVGRGIISPVGRGIIRPAGRSINPRAGMAPNVALPPTVEDLQGFAVCHILALAGDLGGTRQLQVKSDLSRYGISNIEVLMDIGKFGTTDFNRAIDNLASKHPSNEAIQAVWIIHRIEGKGGTLQEAEHIFDMFADSNPRLALIVGLRCYGTDKIASRLFSRSLGMLQDVLDPGYYEAMAISYALQNENNSPKLTGAQRDLLDRHLVDWYSRLTGATSYRINIFDHVGSLLAKRSDLSEYVRFLDNEVSGYQKRSGAATRSPSSRRLIEPLPYPLRNIPDVPDHVVNMVLRGPTYRPSAFSRTTRVFPRASRVNPAKLGGYLGKVQNPVLKIFIAMVSKRDKDAEKMAKDLLSKDQTSLTAYMIAASLATKNDKPLEVIGLLDKARSLSVSPQYMKLIDGAIVASAMDLDPQKFRDEISVGKKAVVRLMSNRFDAQQKEELLVAAETLGLTEQANNLKSQISALNSNKNAVSGSSRSSYARSSDIDLITKFFEGGNTDSALRLALGNLKSVASSSLHPVSSRYSLHTTKLTDLVHTHDADEELIELARPPQKASVRTVVEFGRICELLGHKEKAIAAYEEAIAQDPKDPAVRLQLAIASAKTDPRNSARHLMAIDKSSMNQVGSAIVSRVRDLYRRGRIEEALDTAVVVTECTDLIQDSNNTDVDWIDQVADIIAGQYRHRNSRLYHLYQDNKQQMNALIGRGGGTYVIQRNTIILGGANLGSTTKHFLIPDSRSDRSLHENAAAAEKRRKTHNQLCRKMLEVPQLAEAGFSRLAAEAKARNALTDEFTEPARHVMLTCEPYKQSGHSSAIVGRRSSISRQRIRFICPAEYLVLQAHRKRTLDKLVYEFIRQLRRNNRHDQAEKLKRFADIYTVSPEHFFSTVDSLLGSVTQRKPVSGQVVPDDEVAFQFVIGAYLARHLNMDGDMNQFILNKIREDIAIRSRVHQRFAEYWLLNLVKRDRASARMFYNSLSAFYTGPDGKTSGLGDYLTSYLRLLNTYPGNRNVNMPNNTNNRPSRTTSGRNRTNRNAANRTRVRRSRTARNQGRN